MQPFNYDLTSYELLMTSYIAYAVALWAVSHGIKFLRDRS